MTATSNPLSIRIDDSRGETLVRVARIAGNLGVPFVLVGAFARDVHLEYLWSIHTRRNTADMDLAVQVTDWPRFETLRQAIASSGFFKPREDHLERFVSSNGALVDIIPFGPLAVQGDRIVWPGAKQPMSVVGIQDAYDHALQVEIVTADNCANLRVATLPALVILKLVALREREELRAKRDTNDIDFIMRHSLAAGNRDRLAAGPDADLGHTDPLDLDSASARLIGRDMARISSPSTRRHLQEMLDLESDSRSRTPFVQELQRYYQGDYRRARAVVQALRAGYREINAPTAPPR